MVHQLLSREAHILLLTIGGLKNPALLAVALRERTLDWNRLLWLAEREKAVHALHLAVLELPPDSVRPEHMAQLVRLARVTEFRMLRLERLLADALDTLAMHDIHVVLLKGAGIAATVHGSFAARPMYDLDLLARPDQARTAWNALRAAGWTHNIAECPPDFYESHYHLPPLDDPLRTGLSLELHTAPTDGAVRLTGDMIWNRAREITFEGRSAFVPSTEDQILHLATHFAWAHGFGSAAWRTFNDLYHLTTRGDVNWDAITRDAEATRARTSCYWTFRLARTLAHVDIPGDVLMRLRPPRPEWILKIVERHYAGGLFQFGAAPCPSVRVMQMLWSLGMAPHWSGHGTIRPWHRGEVWSVRRDQASKHSLRARLHGQVTRGAQWGRYVAALLPLRRPADHPVFTI